MHLHKLSASDWKVILLTVSPQLSQLFVVLLMETPQKLLKGQDQSKISGFYFAIVAISTLISLSFIAFQVTIQRNGRSTAQASNGSDPFAGNDFPLLMVAIFSSVVSGFLLAVAYAKLINAFTTSATPQGESMVSFWNLMMLGPACSIIGFIVVLIMWGLMKLLR